MPEFDDDGLGSTGPIDLDEEEVELPEGGDDADDSEIGDGEVEDGDDAEPVDEDVLL